jgi:hypothetical protein
MHIWLMSHEVYCVTWIGCNYVLKDRSGQDSFNIDDRNRHNEMTFTNTYSICDDAHWYDQLHIKVITMYISSPPVSRLQSYNILIKELWM